MAHMSDDWWREEAREPMDHCLHLVDDISRLDLPADVEWTKTLTLLDLYQGATFPQGMNETLIRIFTEACMEQVRNPLHRYLAFCLMPVETLDKIDQDRRWIRRLRNTAFNSARKISAAAKWSNERIRQTGLDEAVKCRISFCRQLTDYNWPSSVIEHLRTQLDELAPEETRRETHFKGIDKILTRLDKLRNFYGSESRSNFQERKLWEKALEFNEMSKERLNALVMEKGLDQVRWNYLGEEEPLSILFSPYVKYSY